MKQFVGGSLVWLAGVAGTPAGAAAEASDLIPAHFSVCVTTVDADGRSRVDSGWYLEDQASIRRAEILREGWIAQGDESDREDVYPPHSVVKATIDPTLVNGQNCRSPSVDDAAGTVARDGGRAPSAVPGGDAIPPQFAVCVTTVDAKYARRDSFWSSDIDARARRTEILRDGWVAVGDEPDREDLYPPHAIVKATVDDVLVHQPACLAPGAGSEGDR